MRNRSIDHSNRGEDIGACDELGLRPTSAAYGCTLDGGYEGRDIFMEEAMTRLALAVVLAALSISSAVAQAPATCESKAIGKDGKSLAGAAKNSFMAKCKREACEPKAVGSDGKALKGAAKNSFMAKCQREQA